MNVQASVNGKRQLSGYAMPKHSLHVTGVDYVYSKQDAEQNGPKATSQQ